MNGDVAWGTSDSLYDYARVHVDTYRHVSCIFTCPARDALIYELTSKVNLTDNLYFQETQQD